MCVCVRARVCVCACVRACVCLCVCVRARVRARVCVCSVRARVCADAVFAVFVSVQCLRPARDFGGDARSPPWFRRPTPLRL